MKNKIANLKTLDKNTIDQIKKMRKDGKTSLDIADDLKLELSVVNEAFAEIAKRESLTEPARVGHFTRLIEKKQEENERLGEHRDYLVLNIRQLEKICRHLEARKKMLDKHIQDMESYIRAGSEIADIFIEGGVEIKD